MFAWTIFTDLAYNDLTRSFVGTISPNFGRRARSSGQWWLAPSSDRTDRTEAGRADPRAEAGNSTASSRSPFVSELSSCGAGPSLYDTLKLFNGYKVKWL